MDYYESRRTQPILYSQLSDEDRDGVTMETGMNPRGSDSVVFEFSYKGELENIIITRDGEELN